MSGPRDPAEDLPLVQKVVAVLWPSFLMAGVATVIFFTVFDPQEISLCMGGSEPVDRLGAYTLGFFAFWLLTSVSSALTCYFRRPCHRPADVQPKSPGNLQAK